MSNVRPLFASQRIEVHVEAHIVTPQAQRSTFVTVLAWVSIVLAGFATLIAVLQNVMLNAMGAFDDMPFHHGPLEQQAPAALHFMVEHVRLFFLSFFILSAGTLVSAVGLLKRKNWARPAFVGILSLGILWNVGGVLLQQFAFPSTEIVAPEPPPGFKDAQALMFVFTTAIPLGLSLLFAWLIWRLLSRQVGAEFDQRSNPSIEATS